MGGQVIDGSDGSGWGLYALLPKLGALRLAASAEHLTSGSATDGQFFGRLSFAAGLPLGDRLAIGAATRLLGGGGSDGSSPWSQELSVLARPWSWISLAWRATGLGVASGAGSRGLTTRYAWGFALRPLAGSDRLTLALDFDWPATDKIGTITASLSTRIVSGLSVMIENRSATRRIGTADVNEQRTSLLVDIGLGFWGAELGLRGGQIAANQNSTALQGAVRLSGDIPHGFVDPGPSAVIIALDGALAEGAAGGHAFARLVLKLDRLARDPAVGTVVFRFDDAKLTWAQVEELRAAIARIRGAGKHTASYAASLGTRGYMVAVATERIGMPAAGALSVRGVGTDWIGLAATLARVGIRVEAIRFSEHKSAPEMFTRSELSDTLRQTLQTIVTRRFDDFLDAVALGRSVTTTVVEQALSNGVVFPEDARDALLIDAVCGPDDFEKELRTWQMLGPDESIALYADARHRNEAWGPRDRIAIVGLQGDIVDGGSGSTLGRNRIGGSETAKVIEGLSERKDVRGVVVRIDSGGGAVYGSDVIYQSLLRLSKRKPTATSMGSVAASGGYWLALGADRIYADSSTITGSIGIWAAKPDLSGLWRRIGLGVTHIGSGPGSSAMGIHKPWTELEADVMRRSLGRYYDLFLDRVSLRRKIKRSDLLELAGGRLWLGDDALRHRLIDQQGGLIEAIADVRHRAGLSDDAAVEILLLPTLSLSDRLQLALTGGPSALLGTLFGALTDTPPTDTPPTSSVADARIGGHSQATIVAALLGAAGPWLDRAALLTALPAGTPMALSALPTDTPAP